MFENRLLELIVTVQQSSITISVHISFHGLVSHSAAMFSSLSKYLVPNVFAPLYTLVSA
jgi:hypothetical protein